MTAWPAGFLRSAHLTRPVADILARNRGYGLHTLVEFTARGRPPELAARLLGPLSSRAEAPR